MEAIEAMMTRKSVRAFSDRPVEREKIIRMLEAAARAPSGGNRQPWRFIVVSDRDKIAKFDPYGHQACVETAPQVIVACANPHDTWEKYDEEDDCYLLDTSAAIQNLLLAAHDQGLGAVWVLSCSKRDVRKLLGIPLHWQIVSIIPFGYPARGAMDAPLRPRKPLADIAFFDGVDAI
mgnify:CR=1 FL=1